MIDRYHRDGDVVSTRWQPHQTFYIQSYRMGNTTYLLNECHDSDLRSRWRNIYGYLRYFGRHDPTDYGGSIPLEVHPIQRQLGVISECDIQRNPLVSD